MPEYVTLYSLAALRQILQDPERKSVPSMIWEAARCWRAKGERPGHYFKSLLYRKDITHPEGFLSQRECTALWARLRDTEVGAVLTDKVRVQQHFQHAPGVRLPRYLGHTEGEVFWDADGAEHALASVEDLARILDCLYADLGDGASIFAKPSLGMKGRGACRVSNVAAAPRLWEALRDTSYIFQESVRQHPDLAAIVPDTLNAFRITTLRADSGEPVVASVWLKVGRRGAVADNAPGMLIIGVDVESGRLFPRALAKFEEGGAVHLRHPDTGYPVGGRPIPYFDEALDMALAAARALDAPLVGWDVGIAEDGPVLLEGNRGTNFVSDEIAQGRGHLDHPVLGPFLRELTEGQGL